MRADLNKLLCERERRGGHRGRDHRPYRHMKKFAAEIDIEEGGDAGRESLTKRYGYDRKEFNENLRPLYGSIRKAVGRRWDSFYSDLCKVFDMRSVINRHIAEHIDDFIARDVILVDEVLMAKGRRYSTHRVPLMQDHREFWVDPRDGTIKKNRYRMTSRQALKAHRKKVARAKAAVEHWLDDKRVLRLIGDTWFIFDVLPLPEDYSVWDRFTQQWVKKGAHFRAPTVYHWRRRTAARELLKECGLIQ